MVGGPVRVKAGDRREAGPAAATGKNCGGCVTFQSGCGSGQGFHGKNGSVDALIHYTSYRFGLTWAAARALVGALCAEVLRCAAGCLEAAAQTEIAELGADVLASRADPATARLHGGGLLDPEATEAVRAFYASDLSLREAGSLTRSLLDHLRSKGQRDLTAVVDATPVVALLLRRVGGEESFTPVMGLPAVRIGGPRP